MNRKEFSGRPRGGKDKSVESELKRKEKEFRRLQQELTMVRLLRQLLSFELGIKLMYHFSA